MILRKIADFAFASIVAVVILAREQRAHQQYGRVDARQFDVALNRGQFHVEEVVEEALVTGAPLRSGPCGAFQKNRNVVSVRSRASALVHQPRSTPMA